MLNILIEFILFMVVQALFINGVNECFKGKCWEDLNTGRKCDGNIFYKLNPEWFEKAKEKWWSKPIFSCVKCQSSLYGTITFWPVVVRVYGFHWEEIFVWVVDMFCLVYLNYYIYKKL